jgi:glycosyltransferase involved in cell wall biosynthesis
LTYQALIVTNLPNFYKVRLFNAIAKECRIFVIFIARNESRRNSDFDATDMIKGYPYAILSGELDTRNLLRSLLALSRILLNTRFEKLIVNDWINLESWFLVHLIKKRRTAFLLESSIHSIQKMGIKELLKKYFLKRVSMVLANGKSHMELASYLGYKGAMVNCKGLGIIHYGDETTTQRNDHFLYVGRLSREKNLELLIKAFAKLTYQLTIVGEGPLKKELSSIAPSNVHFLGYVNNVELDKMYRSHRALILISSEEPYGLVAEESIFYGMPCILSNVCGIVETLCYHNLNSLVVDPSSMEELTIALRDMQDDNIYKTLSANCGPTFIKEKNRLQVSCYVDFLNGDISSNQIG